MWRAVKTNPAHDITTQRKQEQVIRPETRQLCPYSLYNCNLNMFWSAAKIIYMDLTLNTQTQKYTTNNHAFLNAHKTSNCEVLFTFKIKRFQIKSLLLSHHHSTSALVSEILMSVLQTVQKKTTTIYIWTDSAKKTTSTIYIWTDSAKKQQTIYIWTDSAKKQQQQQFTYGQTVQKKQQTIYIWTDSAKKTTNNLHMDRQCKKAALEHLQCSRQCKKITTIYIWTVHIYRLYRRQCAKYTYIYSVHIVYYKDTLNYQRHIIHRMGTSTLCTLSIHNVVYT